MLKLEEIIGKITQPKLYKNMATYKRTNHTFGIGSEHELKSEAEYFEALEKAKFENSTDREVKYRKIIKITQDQIKIIQDRNKKDLEVAVRKNQARKWETKKLFIKNGRRLQTKIYVGKIVLIFLAILTLIQILLFS